MDPLIAALLLPAAYDHSVGEIQVLETHISWILLTGPYAYKLRKPVQLGFVDFSTAALRRQDCLEEVRLNRRLAPDLYLGVRDVHGPPPQARFHGAGEVIDAAVQMRQFDQEALLNEVLKRQGLADSAIDALAKRLALFHDAAAVAPAGGSYGSAALVIAPALANLEVLERCAAGADLGALRRWTETTADRLTPHFDQRLAEGQVREGHGDLHLGNMALVEGDIVVFDCLEFNADLRWIDPISDLAFLVMDLQQVGEPRLAIRLLNGWLSEGGDYTGLHLWRWYFTYRALVRAKVTALRLAQLNPRDPQDTSQESGLRQSLSRYLDLAGQWGQPVRSPGALPQALFLCHGVSGSGKSHLARRLCDWTGSIQLRSDVERRRLFGRWGVPGGPRWPGESGADPYGSAVTDYLYHQRLPACVEAILAAGFSVVVDATFLKSSHRAVMAALARRWRVPLAILSCRVSPELARRRMDQREHQGGDPSEADGAILERQLENQDLFLDHERSRVVGIDMTKVMSDFSNTQPGQQDQFEVLLQSLHRLFSLDSGDV